MADQKISELTALTGANVADDDAIAIVDTSATETKKIVFSELKNALDTATGFVRITGDTMTGALDVQSTITSDGLTVDDGTNGNIQIGSNSSQRIAGGTSYGGIRYYSASHHEFYNTSNQSKLKINTNGDISFFDDQGSSQSFYWDASAEGLSIRTTSNPNSSPLYIRCATDDNIRIQQETHAAIQAVNDAANAFTELKLDGSTLLLNSQSGGNVGIGTSSPSGKLELYGSGISDLPLVINHAWGSSSTALISASAASGEVFKVERSGKVGIGTGSPQGAAHLKGETAALGVDDYPQLTIETAATSGAANTGGGILFLNHDGTGGSFGGSIQSLKENGTSGNSAYYMRFSTRANGGSVTERMRIDSSGDVIINHNTNNAKLEFKDQSNSTGMMIQQIGASGAPALRIYDTAAGSERMRIDASGNLLVGTTNTDPIGSLDSGMRIGDGFFNINRNGASGFFGRSGSDGNILQFYKDNTTVGSIGTGSGVMAIAGPSGNGLSFPNNLVLPSTSSAGAKDASTDLGVSYSRFKDLYLSGSIEIENGTGNVGVGKQALNSNTGSNNTAVGYQAGYNSANSDSTFIGISAGYSASYAGTGRNTFIGYDSGSAVTDGRYNTILGSYNGNQGGLDIRSSDNNIVLSDGAGNPRLYLGPDGDLYIGCTSVPSASVSGFSVQDNAGKCYVHQATNTTGNNIMTAYINPNGTVGGVYVNGSSTTYSTSSDHRLKENVVELSGATDRLKQLEPKRFNFIADADTTVDGFLAHEVQSVVPEAINGTHNEVDDEGNPVYQGIDQSKLVPLLVATIKELEARITALENA